MGYRVFGEDVSLGEAEESCAFTVEALDAHPAEAIRALSRPLASHLEALIAVEAASRKARRAVIRGNARVKVGDGVADDEVRELVKDTLGRVRQDREAPLYRAFFAGAPSDVVAMSLAPEVTELERWEGILGTNAEAAALKTEWQPRIAAVVTRGKEALADRTAAVTASAEASLAARQWVERADRLRRAIDGALTAYAAEHELPRDFNERFFPKAAPSRKARGEAAADL